MESAKIDELERLAKGITPGPWSVKDDWHLYIMDATGKRELAKISNKYRAKDTNAAYIAAACNSVPELIAENRALREQVRELEQKNAALEDRVRYLIEERDGLEWAVGFSSSKEYCE